MPVTSDLRVASVARVAPAASASTAAATSSTKEAVAPATLAKSLAASPPVDADRVTQIKNAIANGTFPLSPSTIADQMIALRYDWMSNDKA